MIKLIACDMDGTLLDENGKLDREFFDIYRKLKKKGILFAVASGRQYYTLRDNFSEIQDDIMYIAENGSYVMYRDEEIYSHIIKKESVDKVIDFSRPIDGSHICICGKKAAYIEHDTPELLKEIRKYYRSYEVVDDLKKVEEGIFKIALCDFRGSAENSGKLVIPEFSNQFQIAVSGKIWIDFMDLEVNKGAALSMIQKKFGITPEETMVFGDYFNDVEMFSKAYHSYAMENAPLEVKRQARFIARSHKEKGVFIVLKDMLAV